MKWRYFKWSSQFEFAVEAGGMPGSLEAVLESREIPYSENPKVRLVLCKTKSAIPVSAELKHKGYYKGVPWRMSVKMLPGSACEVYFMSRIFTEFLAVRMVLLPLLKKTLAASGGVSLIGSVVRHQNKSFILFGYPGCGKTSVFLNAITQGARPVADDEILIEKDGAIRGLFSHIELRYGTVQNAKYWQKISSVDRMKLIGCRLAALLSFGEISLNVRVSPQDLGFQWENSQGNGELIFIHLTEAPAPERVSAEEMFLRIENYDKQYENRFGDYFMDKPEHDRYKNNIKELLVKASLWEVPGTISAAELLRLN